MSEITDTADVALIKIYKAGKLIYDSNKDAYLKEELGYTLKKAVDSAIISVEDEKQFLNQYTELLKRINWGTYEGVTDNIHVINSVTAPENIKPISLYLSRPITTKDQKFWLVLEGRDWANITTWASINIYRLQDGRMQLVYHETFSIADRLPIRW